MSVCMYVLFSILSFLDSLSLVVLIVIEVFCFFLPGLLVVILVVSLLISSILFG